MNHSTNNDFIHKNQINFDKKENIVRNNVVNFESQHEIVNHTNNNIINISNIREFIKINKSKVKSAILSILHNNNIIEVYNYLEKIYPIVRKIIIFIRYITYIIKDN